MATDRSIMRVQLDNAEKNELETLCKKRGMTQIAVMSRLVRWFVRQDPVIQTHVLSTLSDAASAQLAKAVLRRMAGEKVSTEKLIDLGA
jgi:hypothetical protein